MSYLTEGTMNQPEKTGTTQIPSQIQQTSKKPYQKPEFHFEQVFETRALACGKVSITESQCAHNTKTS
jgi:hypothetical protein